MLLDAEALLDDGTRRDKARLEVNRRRILARYEDDVPSASCDPRGEAGEVGALPGPLRAREELEGRLLPERLSSHSIERIRISVSGIAVSLLGSPNGTSGIPAWISAIRSEAT